METDETFVLISMKDTKSKELANAISNETSRKIIAFLTEKGEATETQLAKELDAPLTTIHYNITQLKKTRLIEAKEFFWSKKGKEMPVYKLAKKFIIIAPSDSESTLSKLKNILPVTLISLVGAGIIYLFQKSRVSLMAYEAKTEDLGTQAISGATQITEPNYALWFLIGSLFVILLIFLFNLRKRR